MSASPPFSIDYTVRVSALEPEKTWRLSGDTLWMCIEGQQDIPLPLSSILKLIIIAFFIPTVISWFIKNWPKRFSPHAIPENLLPKG